MRVREKVRSILEAGAPVSNDGATLHVALNDTSRTDLTAMATTALAAASGTIPWPASYSLGWITVENTRISMPEPTDGLALAATVGNYYATVIQRGRNLKDAIIAAADEAAIGAIDIDVGWP